MAVIYRHPPSIPNHPMPALPDCAPLHPGYGERCVSFNPDNGVARMKLASSGIIVTIAFHTHIGSLDGATQEPGTGL
ncbi:hypothetical protein [Celerinatantimonas sp. YJH-8]|uniref:hypothetical protein n=1 Tax=Celerinatantimonas sp. YJH-8 TaxID=3228714 RepID=UPI0038BF13DB